MSKRSGIILVLGAHKPSCRFCKENKAIIFAGKDGYFLCGYCFNTNNEETKLRVCEGCPIEKFYEGSAYLLCGLCYIRYKAQML